MKPRRLIVSSFVRISHVSEDKFMFTQIWMFIVGFSVCETQKRLMISQHKNHSSMAWIWKEFVVSYFVSYFDSFEFDDTNFTEKLFILIVSLEFGKLLANDDEEHFRKNGSPTQFQRVFKALSDWYQQGET